MHLAGNIVSAARSEMRLEAEAEADEAMEFFGGGRVVIARCRDI